MRKKKKENGYVSAKSPENIPIHRKREISNTISDGRGKNPCRLAFSFLSAEARTQRKTTGRSTIKKRVYVTRKEDEKRMLLRLLPAEREWITIASKVQKEKGKRRRRDTGKLMKKEKKN